MSNIYILEPPTSGKILMKTTVGDIDIELWSKEAPKTCRNFIQLCLEGYYNNLIFHRVVKGFIAQGGCPHGDGTGGESVYGAPFEDEFHQRLRFTRRGLLAMANAGKNDNASQFFFTLAATPELNNLHTIFGKVSGDTVFNMLRLEEGIIKNERPEYPHRILKTEVLNNPFDDIVPRSRPEDEVKEGKKKKKEKKAGVKNFKLLSFGAEAEEDEEESTRVNEQYSGKGKSTHDVLDDPKLSSTTIIDAEGSDKKSKTDEEQDVDNDDDDDVEEGDEDVQQRLEAIRNKLKAAGAGKSKKRLPPPPTKPISDEEYDSDDPNAEKKRKYDEIKKEIETVKREYHQNKLKRVEEAKKSEEAQVADENFKEYRETYKKYKDKKKDVPKKGSQREDFTLSLLKKFKSKLMHAKETHDDEEDGSEQRETGEIRDDDIDDDDNFLAHKLKFVEEAPVLAKDANTKDDDWFEIYDPRNPLNKRRRGEKSKPQPQSSKTAK